MGSRMHHEEITDDAYTYQSAYALSVANKLYEQADGS
jgi:hypothetical protein